MNASDGMIRVLILMLSIFEAGGTDGVSTTCTTEACLTLHLKEEHFRKAHDNCINNGGNLVTIRNDNESDDVKSALLAAGERFVPHSRLWIGLALPKGRCTDFHAQLHGFKWTSEPSDSQYANWRQKPVRTCTEKRCVSVSLVDDLKWSDGSCRDSAFYMCKFPFKGMCKPIMLDKPGDVHYILPFLSQPLSQSDGLAMLPHGTMAEIRCNGSEDIDPVFSLCDNRMGPFGWTNPERFCARETRSCAHKNGGCQHLCAETAGAGVRCECRDGYYLTDDKVSCIRRNSCDDSPCESKCVPTPDGFTCACPDGYRLDGDKVSCVDIDECRQNICGQHGCRNSPGSYSCECKPGFTLSAGRCEDVDECAEQRCEQGCLNSQGSFSCYCHAGYSSSSAAPDARGACVDIDECLHRPCEDTCLNTLGSYECSCSPNFTLAENGISCIAISTERPQDSPTSPEKKATLAPNENQLPDGYEPTTISAVSLHKETTKTDSSKRKENIFSSFWIVLCVVGSVVSLLLVIVFTSVFAIHRWKRSKKASKKNATADNYCWVSSGLDNLEKKEQS